VFPHPETIKKGKKTKPICHYITIQGVKIYITAFDKHSVFVDSKDNKKTEKTYDLSFTIPTMIGDKMFDFHYHFGIRSHEYTDITDKQYMEFGPRKVKATRNKTTKKRNRTAKTTSDLGLENYSPEIDLFPIDKSKKIIFFHKTIQNHTGNTEDNIPKGTKSHHKCFFQDDTTVKNINNIVCLDIDDTVMGRKFADFDKKIIKEIMQRPFSKLSGGIKRKTMKNRPLKI
jgi:hypothetical protein